MASERVIDALIKYLKVHGRRILSNVYGQDHLKIELRALFKYYDRASKDDRLMDHMKGFGWKGCRVEGEFLVVPVELIREVVEGK